VKEDMKATTAFRKTLIAFLTVLTLTGFSFTGIAVSGTAGTTNDSQEGEVTSFGFNNPSKMSGLVIRSGTTPILDNDLTRAFEFNMLFNIYDIDGFNHLDVYVVLYKTDTKDDVTDSGFTKTVINSGVTDEALVIRWFSPERSLYLSGLTTADPAETYAFGQYLTSGIDNFLVKSGSTVLDEFYSSGVADFVSKEAFNDLNYITWQVNDSSSIDTKSGLVTRYGEDGQEAFSGMRVIERQVSIDFKMSKVAPKGTSWNYAVYVFDRLQQEIPVSNTGFVQQLVEFAPLDYENQFYGEIAIEEGSEIIFSGVLAGGQFTQSSGVVTARFIANDSYSQEVRSDTTWEPNVVVEGLPQFAYLTANSGLLDSQYDVSGLLELEGNRFALQAFRVQLGTDGGDTEPVDVFPVNTNPNVLARTNGSVYVSNRGDTPILSSAAVIGNAPATNEAGVQSTFRFNIRLSNVFQTQHIAGDQFQLTTYTGNLQLIIVNNPTT
jgi:hypothetical protein